jgi:tRNA uridine 5-carboxymethylaminomethyl modification enzyme
LEHDFFDVVVVGGGHAGAEAAWASSRILGNRGKVAMITMDPHAIGRMSCNPAIGGLAKGQMVREIDALGGLMAHAIDLAGIQFRILNRSKGPAVQSPRAQADKYAYEATVQRLLRENCPNLTILAATVDDILTHDQWPAGTAPSRNSSNTPHRITGVRLGTGQNLACTCAILTTGTFLRGLMHTGPRQTQGGRIGEQASTGLSVCLERLGFELARLKTGTPPRLARETIDFFGLDVQSGDEVPTPFSFLSASSHGLLSTTFPVLPQVGCHITYTNKKVHDLIRENLHRAPMYSGQIQSRGPRYCPSIEDKVVRFADKTQHQIFLEPEGLNTNEIYCNGISTSLPVDIQEEMVHSITGLEKAKVLRWGYAVEYDFVPTHQIRPSLETHRVRGLFFAGQINGTSGYEEAAAQGLMAGINAARHIQDQKPIILSRDQAYIGVMIDDLVTKIPTEPYRMFTSRAEFRLTLRSDNADQRLTPLGRQIGLAEPIRQELLSAKLSAMHRILDQLQASRLPDGTTAADLIRRPDIAWQNLGTMNFQPAGRMMELVQCTRDHALLEQIQIESRYAGYIQRERNLARRMHELENKVIPVGFNFSALAELRCEARDALARFQPASIGHASRLEGITPSDLTVLMMYLTGRKSTL